MIFDNFKLKVVGKYDFFQKKNYFSFRVLFQFYDLELT